MKQIFAWIFALAIVLGPFILIPFLTKERTKAKRDAFGLIMVLVCFATFFVGPVVLYGMWIHRFEFILEFRRVMSRTWLTNMLFLAVIYGPPMLGIGWLYKRFEDWDYARQTQKRRIQKREQDLDGNPH